MGDHDGGLPRRERSRAARRHAGTIRARTSAGRLARRGRRRSGRPGRRRTPRGTGAANSAIVRPVRSPRSYSRSRGVERSRPGRSPSRRTPRSAAPAPGRRTTGRPGRSPRRTARRRRPARGRRRRARRRRGPGRGARRSRRSGRAGAGPAAAARRQLTGGDVGRQRDHRAVAPEPLEGVELPLLLVLDVHHDLAVVDQHPAAVALALAADRLGADLAQLVLDLVDDRLDLPVVAAGGEQEGVGDGELLADVEGDEVGGRACRRPRGRRRGRARGRGRWRSCVLRVVVGVEVVLGDVLDDAVGDEVPDRFARAAGALAAVGGGDRQRRDLDQGDPVGRDVASGSRRPCRSRAGCTRRSWASSKSSSASRQVKISASASAPVMK